MSSQPNAIVHIPDTASNLMPAMTLDLASQRHQTMVKYVQKLMRPNVDFGVIPGTSDKPTLLKPGAEKLLTLFGLTPRMTLVEKAEDWTGKDHGGEPFFFYHFRVALYRNDALIAEADGSANSWEKKHRWRWCKESELPASADRAKLVSRSTTAREPAFAVDKAETGGKYGKPMAHWERFRTAIADGTARKVQMPKKAGGTMDAWEIADVAYRVPNEDAADLVNTLMKMATKRALVAATLLAVNASEFFTADLEDDGPNEPTGPTNRQPAGSDFFDDPPQQTRQEWFLEQWDAIAKQREISDSSRVILGALAKKRKLPTGINTWTDVQCKEALYGLEHATDEQLAKLKPKPSESEPEVVE